MKVLRDPQAMVFIAECEAFLEGRFAEMMEAAGIAPPPWAWMNLLAHGTEDELRAAAAPGSGSEGWRAARAYVAGEMLDAIDNGRTTLHHLQHDVLVPVELDVLSCRCSTQWTPGQLAAGLLPLVPARQRHHGT